MKRPKGLKGKVYELNSKVIRAAGKCANCGGKFPPNELDCHHLISRHYNATHAEPDNNWPLCKTCHFRLHRFFDEMYDFMVKVVGLKRYRELKKLAESRTNVNWEDFWHLLTRQAKELGVDYTPYRTPVGGREENENENEKEKKMNEIIPVPVHTPVWTQLTPRFDPALPLGSISERREVVREQLALGAKIDESLAFIIGELLYEVHRNEYFQEWGYKDFAEYVVQDLEIDPGKAKQLIDVYTVYIVTHQVPPERARQLSFSRAFAAKGFIKEHPDRFDEILNMVETTPTRQLRDWIREERGIDTRKNFKVVLNFHDEEEYANWEEAKQMVLEDCNKDEMDNREIFACLCAEFMLTHQAKPGAENSAALVARMMRIIEGAFGVRLGVIAVNADRYGDLEEQFPMDIPEEKLPKGYLSVSGDKIITDPLDETEECDNLSWT